MTYLYEYTDAEGGRVEVKSDPDKPMWNLVEWQGRPVRRIFTAARLKFNGTGFYETDYKSK